ncbi:unnamed protein product [Hyaloperonospora brassicae]|nr:unnamed protein product [Hyaloperonospora brassicae]
MSTLSTNCNDLCPQYEPCVVYAASACPQGASCAASNQCEIQCFSSSMLNDTATFTFSIGFGQASDSSGQRKTTRTEKRKSLVENEADGLLEEKVRSATADNEAVSSLGTIDLQPTVTSFVLVGGSSTASSVKSKVAKVTFGSDVISSQTLVTNVVLRNLDLTTPTTLQQLPIVLPPSLQKLDLTNTRLTSFPTLVANFTSLHDLNLDMNSIPEVAATAALNSLVRLSLQNNHLNSFRAVFPNLVILDLTNNYFTDTPPSIYIHYSLKELRMKGNPLIRPWFTQQQLDFLSRLKVFDLENKDFTNSIDSCRAEHQRKVHALTVCVSDSTDEGEENDDINEASTATPSSTASDVSTIVGVLVGSTFIIGVMGFATKWLYGRRVPHVSDRHSKIVRESYFGGLSPPLARSPADKGYRGGRRTPSSGGPRFCPSGYETDDNHIVSRLSTHSAHSTASSTTAYSLWNDQELLSLQVKCDEIEDVGTIGSGSFGIIWLVKYRGSQLLASKRLRSDQVNKHRTKAFIEEIKMVAPFDHPNVVRFIGCAWTIETDLQALFEYMENGDLRDYLVDSSSPRHWSQELLQLTLDIIEALVYVHSFTPPLVHRDLKSRNIMLSSEFKAKVADFGASRYKSVDETMTAAVGTGRWLAPEVIAGSTKYDQSVDVFSFGVVLSEMDTHTIPYDDARSANGNRLNDIAILQLVATGQLRPKFGASCPPEMRALANRCLDQDPQKRPPAYVVAYELRNIQRSHYALL